MRVRLESVLPREHWDMRGRGNCWTRRDLEVTDLAPERGQVWANGQAREIVARQARSLPKDQARANVLVSATDRV